MTPFQAVILGLIQGLTEWLPVSSSGHLVLLQQAFGENVPVLFDLVLHVATVVVVIVAFRGDIAEIFRSLGRTIELKRKGTPLREILSIERPTLLAWLIVVGSIPTGIIGFALRNLVVPLFENPTAVGIALLITGAILLLSVVARRGNESIRTSDAVSIGIMQGLSIIPGISRSGSMISVGIALGVDRQLAARYVFLLSIPAILGATTFELLQVVNSQIPINYSLLTLAFISSLLFGYLSLKLLWFVIRRAKIHYFSIYCFMVGFLVLLYRFL